MDFLPGIHRAPNIQTAPDIYEIENRATDPDGLIESAMRQIATWDARMVLDLGAGTGFYVPMFAGTAAHVIAMEPHGPSRVKAMRRVVDLELTNVSIMHGSAEETLLADGSIDICHARFAYFWPPHCEPGIREFDRIMRPGGTAFVIDNDYENGTFGSWLMRRKRQEKLTQREKETYWASFGFSLSKIESEWRFESREDLESVVTLEFGKALGTELIASHSGKVVPYTYCLYHRCY